MHYLQWIVVIIFNYFKHKQPFKIFWCQVMLVIDSSSISTLRLLLYEYHTIDYHNEYILNVKYYLICQQNTILNMCTCINIKVLFFSQLNKLLCVYTFHFYHKHMLIIQQNKIRSMFKNLLHIKLFKQQHHFENMSKDKPIVF